jgi:hypothetical protein
MAGFLFLLCREDMEGYQSSHTGEDMCGVPGNFDFYEIVSTTFPSISSHLFSLILFVQLFLHYFSSLIYTFLHTYNFQKFPNSLHIS